MEEKNGLTNGKCEARLITYQNGNCEKSKDIDNTGDEFVPPDGGTRAWLVLVGSFFCNGILFGVINTYSVLYTEIYENLAARNVSEASGKAALVGSLAMGSTFMISPIAGVLTDAIGIRATTFLGGALASGGMFLSSFCTAHVYLLYFTYGLMYGLGCALAYTPSLAILGHYFRRRIGIVNGCVTAGSSTFTIILPHLIASFLSSVGMNWTLRLLALMASGIMFASLLFKPIMPPRGGKHNPGSGKKLSLSTVFNFALFKNPQYSLWALIIPISLCGYFVPYVHMLKFVNDNYAREYDGKLPVMCIGISSGIGRLIFGYIADLPGVNRIFLQQISFLVVGVCTMLLPSTAGNFWLLIAVILLMGLFDGCFIALLGPVAFDLCGQRAASQGIGFLLGLCSVPLTLGPYVAGIMYDSLQSYDLAFKLAGIPPICGAFAMFAIRCVRNTTKDQEVREQLEQHHQQQSEEKKSMLSGNGLVKNGSGHCNGNGVSQPRLLASSESLGETTEENSPL